MKDSRNQDLEDAKDLAILDKEAAAMIEAMETKWKSMQIEKQSNQQCRLKHAI